MFKRLDCFGWTCILCVFYVHGSCVISSSYAFFIQFSSLHWNLLECKQTVMVIGQRSESTNLSSMIYVALAYSHSHSHNALHQWTIEHCSKNVIRHSIRSISNAIAIMRISLSLLSSTIKRALPLPMHTKTWFRHFFFIRLVEFFFEFCRMTAYTVALFHSPSVNFTCGIPTCIMNVLEVLLHAFLHRIFKCAPNFFFPLWYTHLVSIMKNVVSFSLLCVCETYILNEL